MLGKTDAFGIARLTKVICRFIWSPASDVKKRLEGEQESLKSDVTGLEKKLHYLETTYKNSQDSLERLFKSGAGS